MAEYTDKPLNIWRTRRRIEDCCGKWRYTRTLAGLQSVKNWEKKMFFNLLIFSSQHWTISLTFFVHRCTAYLFLLTTKAAASRLTLAFIHSVCKQIDEDYWRFRLTSRKTSTPEHELHKVCFQQFHWGMCLFLATCYSCTSGKKILGIGKCSFLRYLTQHGESCESQCCRGYCTLN